MKKSMKSTTILIFGFLLILGCTKSSGEGNDRSRSGKGLSGQDLVSGSGKAVENVVVDYPPRYCDYASKFQPILRTDITENLKYFCDGANPTDAMTDLRAFLIENPGKLELKKIVNSNDEANDVSEFKLVWGYYIPKLRPFKVKGLPFYTFIAKDFSEGNLHSKTVAERLSDDTLDPNMHIWSAQLGYDLKIQASASRSLSARRKTQYNLYQVESGNEEMGLGVEHLLDGCGGESKKSILINLSFNDGQGFNDGKGGTVVLNMIHLVMDNKGFPELTGQALDKLGNFLAKSRYDGFTTQ